jgi:hypothetical protein
MTTIYGSDGASIGRSRGKVAESEKQPPLPYLRDPNSGRTGQVNTAQMSDTAPGVSTVRCAVGLVTKSTRRRMLRANPIDMERLKADNQRVKELRERMRRLRENAED